jgi:hypothetical protein
VKASQRPSGENEHGLVVLAADRGGELPDIAAVWADAPHARGEALGLLGNIDVDAGACEDDLAAVGRPDWVASVAGVRQAMKSGSVSGDDEDVAALVGVAVRVLQLAARDAGERDSSPVRRPRDGLGQWARPAATGPGGHHYVMLGAGHHEHHVRDRLH